MANDQHLRTRVQIETFHNVGKLLLCVPSMALLSGAKVTYTFRIWISAFDIRGLFRTICTLLCSLLFVFVSRSDPGEIMCAALMSLCTRTLSI